MPHATLMLKTLNLLLAPTAFRIDRRVDKAMEHIVENAESETGQSADDHRAFVDDLHFVLGLWVDQGQTSPLGWRAGIENIQTRVTNRLRIAGAIAEHPEIEDEPIREPIVVTGLPRTATTLMQILLSHPEGNRAPLLWEMLHTLPADADGRVRDDKVKFAEKFVAGFDRAVPVFPNIHKMGATLPEECIFMMSFHIFMWTLTGDLGHLREWCARRDYTEDYRWLKRTLQVLQYRRPRKRWVLKSPCHLWSLPTLVDTFPDAKIVWTHRDPMAVMASYCSLVEVGWSVYRRRFEFDRLGRTCLDTLVEGIETARRARLGLAPRNVIDVGYAHLAGDAAAQVPRLFEHLGLQWDERESRHLEHRLGRPDQSRRHEYSLGTYGLSTAQVEAAFGDYMRLVEALPALPAAAT